MKNKDLGREYKIHFATPFDYEPEVGLTMGKTLAVLNIQEKDGHKHAIYGTVDQIEKYLVKNIGVQDTSMRELLKIGAVTQTLDEVISAGDLNPCWKDSKVVQNRSNNFFYHTGENLEEQILKCWDHERKVYKTSNYSE